MRLIDLVSTVARALTRPAPPSTRPAATSPTRPVTSPTRPATGPTPAATPTGPGVRGTVEYDLVTMPAPRLAYEPEDDGDPDPGEIVWGWVPYEDDPSQGKDRPMLVVGHGGRDGRGLVGIQLTSQDRADRGVIRQRNGMVWMDIGTGGWDRQGRPSEVRIDRLLLVDPAAVRREGGVLARERFDAVVVVLREHHGW